MFPAFFSVPLVPIDPRDADPHGLYGVHLYVQSQVTMPRDGTGPGTRAGRASVRAVPAAAFSGACKMGAWTPPRQTGAVRPSETSVVQTTSLNLGAGRGKNPPHDPLPLRNHSWRVGWSSRPIQLPDRQDLGVGVVWPQKNRRPRYLGLPSQRSGPGRTWTRRIRLPLGSYLPRAVTYRAM